jgi:DNA-binding MarR family transcriptional regulator
MPINSHSPISPEAVKLLQRIVRLRSHFKVIMPENISTLKEHIRESALSAKGAGINDAGLFYNVGEVFSRYTGPITMGELSRDLDVPLSTATRTMDWMVNNGYAQRLPDPNDRRVVRVELTKTGNKTYQVISSFLLERVKQALSQLSPEERDILTTLLNKVLNAFEEAA